MPKTRLSPSGSPAAGVALTLLGIASVNVALIFDGVAKGLLQGGGIALVLLGVVTISARMRSRENSSTGRGLWLPSRDEERRP